MRRIQVVPKGRYRLYGAMVAKELELSRRGLGTFHRSARKQKNKAKWNHVRYVGWIKLRRGLGEVVEMEVRSKKGTDWQLLHALLGFLDRHFADKIQSVSIQYGN